MKDYGVKGTGPLAGGSKGGRSRPFLSLLSLLIAMTLMLPISQVYAERLKDVASIRGIRENQLVGYGLVVGLTGTGDKKGAMLMSLTNMLYKMGITIDQKDVVSKNVAAVMVTAKLPPFPKVGRKIDATVSAIGDCKSLQGGVLLMTPLKGPDGKVYALAQGGVSIGGFAAGRGGATVQKNFPTVGNVPEGATIEKEFGYDLANAEDFTIVLNKTDFTTASNIKNAINKHLKGDYAKTLDPSSVKVTVPEQYRGDVVSLVNDLEAVDVSIDVPAKVIINERTGTVVIGENVRLLPVAIAHGDLTIEITEATPTDVALQAMGGQSVQPGVSVKESTKVSLSKISGTNLGDIVSGLNKLGVSPRDLIAIMQSIKAAGALSADLEIL
ncbi:MAG: flagellar basal body P-ring protein FlgI [Magnetococcales bacterium]|uniref:Flagellar P-ring protein n=2 Tax=Candidatus Magnetobacterium casense TaxID=1455061 RepID=A0ABS6RVQ1_9BACT|nr:flagellar basal body P-ring protein FlgI [Nitrospirota bacterium]MBV6340522.1 flagellar basal body P-ring protein FlgI [Candidatus Magnetobacterium casensis]